MALFGQSSGSPSFHLFMLLQGAEALLLNLLYVAPTNLPYFLVVIETILYKLRIFFAFLTYGP